MSQNQVKANPATTSAATLAATRQERQRIPMSVPNPKLAVPDVPGYHLHWMLGTPSRIAQAMKAGYEFVDPDEVDVVNTGLADDASSSGNTDLGTRVSVVAGSGTDSNGQEERLYLMKIPQEWWETDQKQLEDKNEGIAAAIRGGTAGRDGNPHGSDQVYIPEQHRRTVADIFNRKTRRT